MIKRIKGARSRCEYAHWVLPICQLYVSDFYCTPLCLTRSRARGCKSRHLQVVLVTYCGVWCEIITVQYVSKFCSGNLELSSTHFWATSLNENTIGRLYFACLLQEIRNKSLLSRALSVHRRKTNMTCTPRREDSFIYKNPENIYKRSVHFRKSRRRESDF